MKNQINILYFFLPEHNICNPPENTVNPENNTFKRKNNIILKYLYICSMMSLTF